MEKRTMRSLFYVLGALSLLFVWQCSPSKDPNTCTVSSDCEDGYRCVRRTCRQIQEQNDPPVAEAGKKQRVRQNSTVELDGTLSADPDGDSITYSWVFIEKPEGSTAEFEGGDSATPKFKADKPGRYLIELVVTDEKGNKSNPSQVIITVYGADLNGDPIADAGSDQTVGIGFNVQLDGSNSTDPDGDPLTYQWTLKSKPDGSAASLSNGSSAKITFQADKAGKYILELIVDDGLEKSAPDTISIEALNDFDLVPEAKSIDPNEGFADTNVKAKITGTGFSNNAIVLFNGRSIKDTDYTVNSASEIALDFNLAGFSPKTYEVKVRNPNGKETQPLTFTVKDLPTPKIEKIDPAKAGTRSKLTITITGTGFTTKTEILFQTTPLKVEYKSEKEMKAALDLTSTLPGKYKITARNPGGRTSDTVEFEVIRPGVPPVLKVINPPSGKIGETIKFSVHGIGFNPGAVIVFDGKVLPSKRIRRDEIQASPDLDLSKYQQGDYKVWVRNPDGVESKNKETFTVIGINPTPTLDRVLPFLIYLDDNSNQIAFYGKRFQAGAKVFIGNNQVPAADVKVLSDTYIEAKVDTTKGTWKAGDFQAYIENPSGKKSGSFQMTVTYRIPTIDNLTPDGWSNKCDTDVNIFGTNFISRSKVYFGTTLFSPTSSTNKLTIVNSKQMKFRLAATQLSANTYDVYVDNGVSAKSSKVKFQIRGSSSVPVPEISSAQPSSAAADTKASITLSYKYPNYFQVGAQVLLNGKVQKTTCTSSSSSTGRCYKLSVELDLIGYKPGTYPITVENPCGVKSKNKFDFLITPPPQPYIFEVNPTYVEVGAKRKFYIKGEHFSPNHQLLWNGKAIPSTYKDAKEVYTTADIDFTNAQPGSATIQVDNKNGQKSQVVKISILPKGSKLVISSVSQNAFDRGKVYKGISIIGKGFTQNTKFYFHGKLVTSKFSLSSQVTVDGLDFTSLAAGIYYLYAEDGGVKSNEFPLLAKPVPPPVIDRLSPATSLAGKDFRLSIYGSRLCTPSTSSKYRCASYPKVLITGPKGGDFSSSCIPDYSFLGSSSSYIRCPFKGTTLKAGAYKVQVVLATGEKSNPSLLNLTPPPPPEVTSIDPSAVSQGVPTATLTLRGRNFVRGATAQVGLQILPTNYSSTSRMTVTLSTLGLPIGNNVLILRNPDGQQAKPVTFGILPPLPPVIRYANPDVAYSGYKKTLDVYGENITNGTKLLINGKAVKATYSSSGYLSVSNYTFPPSATTWQIQLQNPDGKKSNVVKVANRGNKPYISYLSPSSYTYPSSGTRSISVYGSNFGTNPKVDVDGTSYTPTSKGTTYVRFSYRVPSTTVPKNVTIKIKSGTQTSNSHILTILPKSSYTPRVTYMYTSSLYSGAGNYTKGRFYTSGSGFTKTSKIYFGGNLLKTRYSSSSRLYVDAPLNLTTLKSGHYYFEIRSGSKKSNFKALRIETGIQRGNRSRITKINPFWGQKGKTVTMQFTTSNVGTSSTSSYPEANKFIVIMFGPVIKTFPLIYKDGKFTLTVPLNSFPKGIYNVVLRNKTTNEDSGGSGFIVF